MTDEMLRQALGAATTTVVQYAGSDASKAVTSLVDVLLVGYARDLEEVKPEGLAKLQGQVAQLRALRRILVGDANVDPRI